MLDNTLLDYGADFVVPLHISYTYTPFTLISSVVLILILHRRLILYQILIHLVTPRWTKKWHPYFFLLNKAS